MFLIRKQKYIELSSSNYIEALEYLQTKVGEVTNHNDPKQSLQFRRLASHLCQPRQSLYFFFSFFLF